MTKNYAVSKKVEVFMKIIMIGLFFGLCFSSLVKDKKNCDIVIDFGSYGSGTNHDVRKKVNVYLKDNTLVSSHLHWGWGREGEFTKCLVTKNKVAMDKVFTELKKIIPDSSKKAPITMKAKDGRVHDCQWPK